jgi:hypothetical protein
MNYIMLDSKIPDNPTAQRVAEEARMLQQRVNRLESAVRSPIYKRRSNLKRLKIPLVSSPSR